MSLKIDLKIFVLGILFFFTKQIQIYATIMLFAFLHELGHLVAGLLLGMKPQNIKLNPFGVSIGFKMNPKDYNKKIKKGNQLEAKKILVALAGPLTNVCLIILLLNSTIPIIKQAILIYSNIILILLNILPIYPLDGGRVLKGILHINFGKYKARKYTNRISFITISLLTVIASISILYLKNIAIFLVILYLWILMLKEDKKYRTTERMYQIIQKEYSKIT